MANRKILFWLVGVFCVFCVSASVCSGQSLKSRIVEKIEERNEPVKIRKISLKDESIELGKSFLAGDEWLKALALQLENTSGKPISYLSVEVFVPEIQSEGDPLLFSLEHGVLPIGQSLQASKGINPTSFETIKSGDSLELVFPERMYTALRNYSQQNGQLPNIKRVRVRIGLVVFEDGTAWKHGYSMRPDKTKPGWVVDDKTSKDSSLNPKTFRGRTNFMPVNYTGSAQGNCGTFMGTFVVVCGDCFFTSDLVTNDNLSFGAFGQRIRRICVPFNPNLPITFCRVVTVVSCAIV